MTTAVCIILGGVISTIATLLLVEEEINFPIVGSGAGKRRAEKRAAEAADGVSILKGASEADRSHTPVNRVRLSALHPISTGSPSGATPAKQQNAKSGSNWVQKCREALTSRVPASVPSKSSVTASGQCPPVDSSSGAARCLVPDSDQPAS